MKKKTLSEFINNSNRKHNNKYNYSLVNYINNSIPVTIVCPIHGEFKQRPSKHVYGQGCKQCGRIKTSDHQSIGLSGFIKKAKEKHGGTYDYSKVNYINYKTPINIICSTHGEFMQLPSNHLSGKGCKYCGKTAKMDTKMFIDKSKGIYGDEYNYDKVDYVDSTTPVTILCPEHGEFETTPNNFIMKERGCSYCYSRIFDTKSFITKTKLIHGNKYNYDKVDYVDSTTPVTILCPEHGEFNIRADSHRSGHGCRGCSNSISNIEKEVVSFIDSLNINFIENDRTLLDGKELDIYIPSKNIAIEFNGLYWHSDLFIDKHYHLNKTNNCEKLGIQLIHIFEDEWLYKQDIVKSRLRNILGLTTSKIYGRKCDIKEVTTKDKGEFLNDNHIQGTIGSKINLGLYYKDELISLMTFGKRPMLNNCEYELIRFCNKLDTSVIGGASKLLKYFIRNYNPNEIISYADRRWSNGGMYEKLGFDKLKLNQPSFFIIEGKLRKSRFKYQKHKLNDLGFDVDKDKSALENLSNNNINIIYDSGSLTYSLNIYDNKIS
jgi:hypothetical protein